MPTFLPKTRLTRAKPSANGDGHAASSPFPEERRPAPKPRAKPAASVPRPDVPELAWAPDLIGAIRRDIQAMGVVGEEENALLVYLVYTSRLLDNPAGIITRGGTCTGKSTLLYKIAELFPVNQKIDAMRITEAALFNTQSEHCLEHTILIMGERKHSDDEAARDANAMIRQLLSEKRITRMVSVPCGKDWVSEEQERKGPVAYAESTTAKSVFDEDLNRLLQVYLDDSEEQTRAVMLATAGRYLPDQPEVDEEAIIQRHHEFQASLKTRDVRIPFAIKLAQALPAEKAQSRRIIQQVITVIAAITLLHQHQREHKDGYLLATRKDYELARRLLLKPLSRAIGLSDSARKLYDALRAKKVRGIFTTTVAEKLGGFTDKMTCHRALKELKEKNVLRQVAEGKSHTPAQWQWDGKALDETLLPEADSVFDGAS